MADIDGRVEVVLTTTIKLTEIEVRALDALAGYGDDAFIKAFYSLLGSHYMKPHEAGLRSFLVSVRRSIPGLLYRTKEARDAFRDPPKRGQL